MAFCEKCVEKAIFSSPFYCGAHFIDYFEEKVKRTIKRFNLIKTGEKIAVAVSGGKDSQTILYLLNKFYGNVTAISIDEGISGYRDKTLSDMREFCKKQSIPYEIHSFEKEYGRKLEDFLENGAPSCRFCGVLRRHLLNKNAEGFDLIATGHNLDDECQSLIMNLFKGNLFLCAKMGPKSGIKEREGFTQRVKPLYLCSEKEVASYAFLMGFPVNFIECPHAAEGFRQEVRTILNEIEAKKTGTKLKLLEHFLKMLPLLEKSLADTVMPRLCVRCRQPSIKEVCMACRVVSEYAK